MKFDTMAHFLSEGFDIPVGFIKDDDINGQLCYEDLDDDSELWLIRMPSDIELSDLDKKKVHLGDNSKNVKTIETEKYKLLECLTENCEIPNLCVVLPEKSGRKLHAVHKVFKGALLISEGDCLVDNTEEVKCEIDNDQQGNTVDDTHNSTRKSKERKSKKKKKHSHNPNEDLNYETEEADNVVSPLAKHKRSKKCLEVNRNETDESMEIKSEPESMDLDGFPPCRSQK